MSWVAFDADGWPEVAASLPHPWPESAALFDLRWHARTTGVLPGRERLRRRWGWTDWKVKVLLRDDTRWADPTHRQVAARTPPADRQVAARSDTDEPGQRNGNHQAAARPPPGRRQPTATRVELREREKKETYPSPQPRPAARAGSVRSSWVAEKATAELVDRQQAGRAVDDLLVAYETGAVWLVDNWVALARGTGHNGHRVRPWPDAPTGIRRRDITAGLAAAARNWRAQTTET